MKKTLSLLLILCLLACWGGALAEKTGGEESAATLVAYFSATGNTRPIAEYAAEYLAADLYQIVPAQPYTDADLNYNDPNSRTSAEMSDDSARPAIDGQLASLDPYDVIFLGYPIWWGQAPRIISTFLESLDFSGKTVVPFCTSGSSGVGSSADTLHALCAEDTLWLEGKRFAIGADEAQVAAWIDGLRLNRTAR